MERSIVVAPCRRLSGSLRVPGDKSISHRALMVAGVAEGESSIVGLSPAADVASTAAAIRALGVGVPLVGSEAQPDVESLPVSSHDRDREILVQGAGWRLREPSGTLDVGNSGSTIRMMLGLVAGLPISVTFDGDDSIRRRPMGRVIEPLRAMGAAITADEGRAPVRSAGATLLGLDHELPIASAQVKSAILFAGMRAEGVTTVGEASRSRDHTERMLRYAGAPIDEVKGRLIIKSTDLQGTSFLIPGDLSSAAFLLVAAAILDGSHIEIPHVGVNPTRSGILDVLEAYGASISVSDVRDVCGEPVATVSLASGDRRPLDLGGELVVRTIDELPLIAVLGAAAEGETVVRDAAELRVKESDRIAAITTGLRRLGADIIPTPDGFVVRGSRLTGGEVDAAGDHRIAMALAVAALMASGKTTIDGWDAVPVSYPRFAGDLGSLVVP